MSPPTPMIRVSGRHVDAPCTPRTAATWVSVTGFVPHTALDAGMGKSCTHRRSRTSYDSRMSNDDGRGKGAGGPPGPQPPHAPPQSPTRNRPTRSSRRAAAAATLRQQQPYRSSPTRSSTYHQQPYAQRAATLRPASAQPYAQQPYAQHRSTTQPPAALPASPHAPRGDRRAPRGHGFGAMAALSDEGARFAAHRAQRDPRRRAPRDGRRASADHDETQQASSRGAARCCSWPRSS